MGVVNYDVNVFCNLEGNIVFKLQVLMLLLLFFFVKIFQLVGEMFGRVQVYKDYFFRIREGEESFMLRNGIFMVE